MDRPLENGWLADTPTDDSILRQFVLNQAELNSRYALAVGGEAEAIAGCALADARSAVPYLNQAVLTAPPPGEDDALWDQIDAFAARSDAPFTILSAWPTPDLSHRGWTLYGHPMLVARPPGPWVHRMPDDVWVSVVASDDDRAEAQRVAVEGYPMPEAADMDPGALFPEAIDDTGLQVRVGWLDGEAVGVANVFSSHGVTNLCLAATLPAARRRGVWASLVWERVAVAPDQAAVAFTSDYSRPGFVRMGFLPFMRLTMWGR